jgi:hypothetical protein
MAPSFGVPIALRGSEPQAEVKTRGTKMASKSKEVKTAKKLVSGKKLEKKQTLVVHFSQ